MSEVIAIVDVYKRILESLGCKIEDSLVSVKDANEQWRPFTMEGKRFVIPTRDILRAADWKEMVAFHPLSESVTEGESAVLKRFRRLVIKHLTTQIGLLLMEITRIAIDTERHSTLSPQLTGLLAEIPDIDAATMKAMDAIMNAVNLEDKKLVNVYLKRKAEISGTTYRRGAIVSFPFMDDVLDNAQKTILGVTVRKKDKAIIKALMNWILPGFETGAFSKGSNSDVAPYFDALIRSYLEVQRFLNAAVWKFRDHIVLADEMTIDISWEDDIGDLRQYVGQVPALAGNIGTKATETPQGAKLDASVNLKEERRPEPRREEVGREREKAELVEKVKNSSVTGTTSDGQRSTARPISVNPNNNRGRYRDDDRDSRPMDEVEEWGRLVSGANSRRSEPRFAPRGDRGRDRDDRYDDRRDRGSRYRDDDRDYQRDSRDGGARGRPRFAPGNHREDRHDDRRRGRYEDDRYDDRRDRRGRGDSGRI